MKKRSAILMAAGLVVALVAGAVAMTIGFSGTGTAEAGSRAKRDPVVRTIRRTITVHKDAKATDQASVQVVRLSSSDPSSMSDPSGTGSESDDSFESESESDDDPAEFEDESSDGSEDHSSDDSTRSGSEDEFGDD
jgi:hypothetical protein